MALSRTFKFAAAAVLGFTTVAAVHAQSMKPESAIKARQAIQRVILVNISPLAAMAKGKAPFNAEVATKNANLIKALSEMPILSFYADGTENVDGVKTRALPDIWLAKDKFQEKLEAFRVETAKLAKTAASGDEAAFKQQVGATAKACDNCHDSFRAN